MAMARCLSADAASWPSHDHQCWTGCGAVLGQRDAVTRGPSHRRDEEDHRAGGDDGITDGEGRGHGQRSREHEDVAQEREERVRPDERDVGVVADRQGRRPR